MVEGQTGRQTLLLRRDAPARHALVFQPVNAVRARRAAALRSGGTLLLTMPAASRVERSYGDYWRFTARGVEELLARNCPEARSDVRSYGNVLACTAFLLGLAAQELRTDRLRDHDPNVPLVVCARPAKPG